MKSESLLSQLSNNSSQLSNVSYRGQKKHYTGTDFFRESFLPGQRIPVAEFRQEQIQLDSLGMGALRNFAPVKDTISAFTPYWTTELHHDIQGTSDNEGDGLEAGDAGKQQQADGHERGREQQEGKELQGRHEKGKVGQRRVEQKEESEESNGELSQAKAESGEQEQKTMKNETKNIPKNYGKAIIIFIQKNRQILQKQLEKHGNSYESLLSKLRHLKKKINTISDLRNLWQQQQQSKSLRIISNAFLRKHSLHYIYNSRIKTRLCHAKYKRRLQEAIVNPKDFNHIKDY